MKIIESNPILKDQSLKDYDRAYINTKPDYKNYINSGMIIPFYKAGES